jgi:hypothetical protein
MLPLGGEGMRMIIINVAIAGFVGFWMGSNGYGLLTREYWMANFLMSVMVINSAIR